MPYMNYAVYRAAFSAITSGDTVSCHLHDDPMQRQLRSSEDANSKKPRQTVWAFCVGANLFFRAVSSQVSSAQLSLTSVFGMGTGVPSV